VVHKTRIETRVAPLGVFAVEDFDGTVTASQACRIARLNTGTLRVLKSRWQGTATEVLPEGDGKWTRYSFKDVLRLTVIARLAEIGISTLEGGPLAAQMLGSTEYLHGFRDDVAYLVVSTGMLGEIIQTTPRGAPAAKSGAGKKIYAPGILYPSLIKGADLAAVVADPDRYVSVIVNLDEVERHVKANWPRAD
jgi:hypothetical protein